jgi:hypothetical protein
MNFFYILLLLFLKIEIIINQDQEEKQFNKSFNNDYSHIYMEKDDDTAVIYSATYLSYIKLNFRAPQQKVIFKNIGGENINISFNCNNIKYSYSFHVNETKINYLGKKKYKFINKTNKVIFNFIENGEINKSSRSDIDCFDLNYNCGSNEALLKFYVSSGENFFIDFRIISLILIISGCFSMLYGGFHYILGLIPHCTFFMYFLALDVVGTTSDADIIFYYLFLFFSLVTSIIFITFFKNNNMVLKLFYGCFFGFSLFKIACYYYIFFGFPLFNVNIYIGIMTIFILVGLIINLFDFLKEYAFLPCAVVSGSFYVMKGSGYLIGGYFSDIIMIKEALKFHNPESLCYRIINIIIHILLIALSFFCQINHYKLKMTGKEDLLGKNFDTSITRESDASNISSRSHKKAGEEEQLIDKTNETLKEEEESGILDQED